MVGTKVVAMLGISAIVLLAALAYAMPEKNTILAPEKNIDINSLPVPHPKMPVQPTVTTGDNVAVKHDNNNQEMEKHVKTAVTEANKAKERMESAERKEHNMPSKTTHSEERASHVKYKPSPEIVIPIPEKMAKSMAHENHEEHNEMHHEGNVMENGARETNTETPHIKTMCEHGQCYIVMDKNVSPKMINAILEKTIRTTSHAKVRAEVIRKQDFAVVKAVVEENSQTHVEYATADQGIFAVTVEIPKTEVNNPSLIEGNVIFLKTDPVLRIYLRSEGNEIAVAGFTVKKAVELNTTDALEFAACTLGIRNVQTKGDEITFQITDGNQPVYVPSVKIETPGTLILPQYDAGSKTYSAKIQNTQGARIVAYVQGCGEIIYPLAEKAKASGGSTNGVAAIVVILGIIAVAVLVISRA
ncbi:MAG: hypothetical protein GXN93_01630 [Candidatus Diapherotrites archaeon]|nr:hypothetical protein [Candidatus Diapherotrites archaeon]